MERTSLEIIITQILACVFVFLFLASLHRSTFIKIQKKIITNFRYFPIFTVVPAIFFLTVLFCRTIFPSLSFNRDIEVSDAFETYVMMTSLFFITLIRLSRGCLAFSEKSEGFLQNNKMFFNFSSVVGKLSVCLSLYMIFISTYGSVRDKIMFITLIVSLSLIDFARLGLDEVKRRELQNNE